MKAKLIKTTAKKLEQVAICYMRSFPKSLKTLAGKEYVRSNLDWFIQYEYNDLFHLENQNGEIVGFYGSMLRTPGLAVGSTSGMIQHSFSQGIKSLLLRPWLFFHPELIDNYGLIITNIRNKIFVKKQSTSAPLKHSQEMDGNALILIAIGVDPNEWGKGYGNILLGALEDNAKSKGASKLLLSVRIDNTKAISAYHRNGWLLQDKRKNSQSMIKIIT